MTFAQLEALVAVVESGSFSRAAERLSVSQSGVSHMIAALEAELGGRLFLRLRSRGVTPTEFGERVLAHAQNILARARLIHEEASSRAGLRTGRVRLAALPSVTNRLLPRALGMLRRRHPGIEIVLLEGTDDDVRSMIESGAADLGFVTLPSLALDAVDIAADDMLVVSKPDPALSDGPRVPAGRLAEWPFVMSTGGCEPEIRAYLRAQRVRPRVVLEVRDTATLLAIVREGLGVTIVPALALPARRDGLLIRPLDPPFVRRIGIAAPSWQDLSAAARVTADALLEAAVRIGFGPDPTNTAGGRTAAIDMHGLTMD